MPLMSLRSSWNTAGYLASSSLIWAVVEQVQPCPVQVNMLQPVTTEQGGSSTRDNEEVELVLLVLVRNMDHNDTKDRDFLTCICGELCRRGKEWRSSVRGPKPVLRLFAHDRQGCTCIVHFHGGFGITESYRDFDRHGPHSRGVVESTQCPRIRPHVPPQAGASGILPQCELPTSGHGPSCSRMTDLLAVVTSGSLELAGGG